MEDSIQFSNMDSWKGSGNKFGLTYKDIVIEHIRRCVINASCEWHGGYWQERMISNHAERYYVQNSRDVYCNSVRILRSLLSGYFDKKMEGADKRLSLEFDKVYQEYKKKNDKESKLKYFEEKIDVYMELFEELVKLAKRLNYFQEETSEEVM